MILIKKGLGMGGKMSKEKKGKKESLPTESPKSANINTLYQVLSDSHHPLSEIILSDASETNVAVMHNFIARAVTRWSLEESKLFICALAQIGTHDENGWIKLSKRDLNRVLEYKNRSSKWLRRITKNVAINSWLQFETEAGWDDGFVVNRTRSDRWNIYIRFEKDYLPLLEKLTSHFTTVYVESIAKLNHKSSYSLYLYLKSWADPSGKTSYRYIYKRDIHSIFNLEPGSYIKNPNTDRERFDWYNFEKYCLIPAIEDINKNDKGEIEIFEIKKIKSSKNSRYVNGYYFSFRSNNAFVESLNNPKFIEYGHKDFKKRLLMSDSLPTYEEVEELISDLDVSVPEVFKRLAEQHKKRDISDWKSYTKKIASNILNSSSAKSQRKSETLPDWYTYTPTEKASPELLLKTYLLQSEISKTNPYDIMDRLVKFTGMDPEKIGFYIENPVELDKLLNLDNKNS